MEIGKYDIIVCGDSFCSATITNMELKNAGRRAHFSQILEDEYGYRVLNLAHGAMSNFCICFQIREAVKLRPKVIIYNRTFEGRINLMLNQPSFNTEAGLSNFLYWDQTQVGTQSGYVETKQANAECISIVHQGLRDHPHVKLSEEQLNAVDMYLKHFFNWAAEKELTNWMYGYWETKMQENNIQFLRFHDPEIGKIAYDFSLQNRTFDTPFHTDKATQQVVAANIHQMLDNKHE